MTAERLAEILAAYGAHPERWPEAEREAALRLLATDDGAARLARAAAALDARLGRYVVPAVDSAMIGRAIAAIPARGVRSILGKWWVGAAFAGAGAAGMAVGVLAFTLAAPPLTDRQFIAWADDPPTIFNPVDLEEILL